jgi:hypothetical protein
MNALNNVIELQNACIVTSEVLVIVKGKQPATLQTPDIPYLHFNIKDGHPVVIPYETDEEVDADYLKCLEAVKLYRSTLKE